MSYCKTSRSGTSITVSFNVDVTGNTKILCYQRFPLEQILALILKAYHDSL